MLTPTPSCYPRPRPSMKPAEDLLQHPLLNSLVWSCVILPPGVHSSWIDLELLQILFLPSRILPHSCSPPMLGLQNYQEISDINLWLERNSMLTLLWTEVNDTRSLQSDTCTCICQTPRKKMSKGERQGGSDGGRECIYVFIHAYTWNWIPLSVSGNS